MESNKTDDIIMSTHSIETGAGIFLSASLSTRLENDINYMTKETIE
jgi:hypothetical protein